MNLWTLGEDLLKEEDAKLQEAIVKIARLLEDSRFNIKVSKHRVDVIAAPGQDRSYGILFGITPEFTADRKDVEYYVNCSALSGYIVSKDQDEIATFLASKLRDLNFK